MKTKIKGRIEETFERLGGSGGKALITFITAGDPDIPTTKDIIFALEKAGADIIELGVPFSDPMADGPTIQASSERAVKKGTRLNDVLQLVKDVRKKSEIPIVLFGYYNPVLNYGLRKFARDAKAAGADGVLIVDLPAEESDELKRELDKEAIDIIFLLTPTSTADRIKLISGKASGFLYFVSVTGVTGARKAVSGKVKAYVNAVRPHTDLPVGVGFGISTPEQAREVSGYADGVIVGSALVNIIAKNSGSKGLLKEVSSFTAGLKNAISR
ncbi:MAG: tryptophan synthase subunit alpha [Deltaproteobacteria bacterium]|nr:tryptophan synthase subunit alpha [Deltaproteobacteria bacterium]